MSEPLTSNQQVEQCMHAISVRCGLPYGHKGPCVPKMWEPEDSSWYVEELSDGHHWRRTAVSHMWAKEKDAKAQLRQLQKQHPEREYRLRGPA